MKVILEVVFGDIPYEPVLVPVSSYAEGRKVAHAMAESIMAFYQREHWDYEWPDDRHAFLHHAAFRDEDRADITIVGDAATAKAEKWEKCDA